MTVVLVMFANEIGGITICGTTNVVEMAIDGVS
jgi:hypothetical protein